MRSTTCFISLLFIFASKAVLSSDIDECRAQTSNSFSSCKKLADDGNPDGIFGLGMLYLEGIGVSRDFDKSFKLMHKAAMLGNAFAQLQLGQAYVNGHGVTQDFEEGYVWLLIAKENGNEIAQQGIDFMNQRRLIEKSRMNAIIQRANDLYAKTQNKRGFQYVPEKSTELVSGLLEYCDMVMPTVDAVIKLRKYNKPRSAAQQLMIGMTDQRAIKMMEGVIEWVWTTGTPVSQMYSDFKKKCLRQSSEVGFIFP